MRVPADKKLTIKSAYENGISIKDLATLTGYEPITIERVLFGKPSRMELIKKIAVVRNEILANTTP